MHYSRETNKSWILIKLIIFYSLLSSCRASCTFGDSPYIDLLLSAVCFIYFQRSHLFVLTAKRWHAVILLTAAALYTMHGATVITAYLGMFFMIFLPLQLLCLKREIQVRLFISLSKYLAALLVPTYIIWLLYMMGVNLPHTSRFIETTASAYGAHIYNYILFQINETVTYFGPELIDKVRFNGFCLEPGHMGTIVAFFLAANRFDMSRWWNKVFLFIALMTLSAACYLLLLIGYLFHLYCKGALKKVYQYGIALGLVLVTVTFVNSGDNYVNELIIGKWTREEGAIDGRFSQQTERLWEQIWVTGDFVFGLGAGAETPNSAGYKVYVIMNGVVGSALLLLAYYSIYKTNKSRYGLLLLLLYYISFLQRVYGYWDAFIDPFILALPMIRESENRREKKAATSRCPQIKDGKQTTKI